MIFVKPFHPFYLLYTIIRHFHGHGKRIIDGKPPLYGHFLFTIIIGDGAEVNSDGKLRKKGDR
jgi:hypothetical protein